MKLDTIAPCMPIIAALPATLAGIGYTYTNCEIDYAEYHGDACNVRVYAVVPGCTAAEHVGTITAAFTQLCGSPNGHDYVFAHPIAYLCNEVHFALAEACMADERVMRDSERRLAKCRLDSLAEIV